MCLTVTTERCISYQLVNFKCSTYAFLQVSCEFKGLRGTYMSDAISCFMFRAGVADASP